MDNNGAAAAVAGGIMKDEIPYNPIVAKSVILAWAAVAARLRQLLPRRQRRSGAKPCLAEDLGGHGRLPDGARQVPGRAPAAAVEAAGKDGPADKAAFAAAMQADLRRAARPATRPTAPEN